MCAWKSCTAAGDQPPVAIFESTDETTLTAGMRRSHRLTTLIAAPSSSGESHRPSRRSTDTPICVCFVWAKHMHGDVRACLRPRPTARCSLAVQAMDCRPLRYQSPAVPHAACRDAPAPRACAPPPRWLAAPMAPRTHQTPVLPWLPAAHIVTHVHSSEIECCMRRTRSTLTEHKKEALRTSFGSGTGEGGATESGLLSAASTYIL